MCADKYNVPPLIEKCWHFVGAKLSVDNCLTMLEEGIEWHAEEIVTRCLQFIHRYAEGVLQSEYFSTVKLETLVMIVQSPTLVADEHNIYLAIERWAEEACRAGNLDPSGANRRQVLGEALFRVRFPLLSNTQLADGPVKSGLLLHSEVHDLYQYKFATVKPPLPFPTEARGLASFRIGDTVLEYSEQVFVQRHRDTKTWQPVVIVGAEQGEFRYAWQSPLGAWGEDVAASEQILKASQFLKPGPGADGGDEGRFKDGHVLSGGR
ncbi:BTB/POZ domain-containing protein 6-B-like isoform X2 [Paramacrobiotus metropolitanus]|nr:BTB/POZ domain-containing protein 6-B-like isoform X2 [Paramacrobiotus metropolitanus]